MRNLLFLSLVWGCLLAGCASARSGCRYSGEKTEVVEWDGIVREADGVNKFNLQIDIAKRHFSGMLLVKQTGKQQCRTVFTTHFGMRVFDLEFRAGSMVVHYCMEPVKKEKVLRLLRNDFSRLWGIPQGESRSVKVYGDRQTAGGKIRVYRTAPKVFYRKNVQDNRMEMITSGRGWKKTSWFFGDFKSGYPSIVRIRHAFWPVRLELNRL